MMNVLTHKGYSARIDFDPRDGIFVGRVLGIPEQISFHAETVGALKREMKSAVEHYLADCAATGRAPAKAASGKLMLRIPPEIHAAAGVAAQAAGKSLNQWAAEILGKAARST